MEKDTVALVTGGSKGLGRALVLALLDRSWTVITDGRTAADLDRLERRAEDRPGRLVTVRGDVTDPAHRAELVAAVAAEGRLDLLVNNASTLGVTPLTGLMSQPGSALIDVLATNLIAPHDLAVDLVPFLRRSRGVLINITSDAAVEGFPGWGPYGASKSALEQWSNVLAAEESDLSVYWVDPGDLRTDLHQAAFPGEDISDRPLPEVAIPGLLHLVEQRPPSGRAKALAVAVGGQRP